MATEQTPFEEPALPGNVTVDVEAIETILEEVYGPSRGWPSGGGGFMSGSAAANRIAAPRPRKRAAKKPAFSRTATSTFQNAGPSRAAPTAPAPSTAVPSSPFPSGPFSSGPFSSGPLSSGPFSSDPPSNDTIQGGETSDAQQPAEQTPAIPAAHVASLLASKTLTIVQGLPFGPSTMKPPADDPFFAKLEPNSNTKLSSRSTPNNVVEAHLDCRTYVTISQLYSICIPKPSHDGDFTVPIEGEWVTMTVLTHLTEVRKTMCRRYDYNGNQIDEKEFDKLREAYRSRKGREPDDVQDEDNPERMVKKMLPTKEFRIATLTDLGEPLDRSETKGDSIVQMLLLKADESRVGPDGKRTYVGGSHGIFEMFESMKKGTLVCLLNPIVRKSKDKKETLRQKGTAAPAPLNNGLDDKMLSLSARSRDCAMTIGMAADYGQCTIMGKSGERCGDFVDSRTRLHICPYHMETATRALLKGRQEFANGTSAFPSAKKGKSGFGNGWKGGKEKKPFVPFKTYEEMACSQSKAYVFKGNGAEAQKKQSSDPSNQHFRVDAHLGRDKEARRLGNEDAQRDEDERVRARLAVRIRAKQATQSAAPSVRTLPASKSPLLAVSANPAKSAAAASAPSAPHIAKGHGSKAVQEALKKINAAPRFAHAVSGFRPADKTFIAPTERKRAVSTAEHAFGSDADRAPRKRTAFFDPFTGKMRQERDPERTSVASVKLLARHNASAASLPKPIMNSKRVKSVSSVRPPSGQFFHALDDSDEELDAALGAMDERQLAGTMAGGDDDDSDLEIVD